MRCVICERSTLFPTPGRRGCCWKCYKEQLKLVKEGKTTWEILEAEGKALKIERAKSTWLPRAKFDAYQKRGGRRE